MESQQDVEKEYSDTLNWLFSQLPAFSRIGAAAYKPSLDNIIHLCEKLDNPQHKFKSIHIGGTNGKGSCSNMLASTLQSSGYKTALYTSPHISDFRERIRIDGVMIPREWVIEFADTVRLHAEALRPSFFEITVAMAFAWFASQQVDIAIVEVGLGGLLDSTNIIVPEVAVITNISWDHTQFLGNTLAEIATQKAGIIKPNVPVVIGETQSETEMIFIAKSIFHKSPIFFADTLYQVVHSEIRNRLQYFKVVDLSSGTMFECSTDLLGSYQAKNICTVLTVLDVLKNQGWKFPFLQYKGLIFNTRANCGFLGRFDMISQSPSIILDVSHNEAGITELFDQIGRFNFKNLHIVTGFVADKEIDKILSLFPVAATYYFVQADIPRALNADVLRKKAAAIGLTGDSYSEMALALQNACERASQEDAILVTGSFFILHDAYKYFEKKSF